MTGPAAAPEQPRWLQQLAAALQEALPRLHGAAADPLVAELIEALTVALAEGRLEVTVPSAAHRAALLTSPLAAEPCGPLVLEGERLQWRRWQQQRLAVRHALLQRARQPLALPVDPALLARHGEGLDAQQQQAVAAVLSNALVLLEGGPGTGKTSTVSRMLAAAVAQQPGCRIQLAAPTGKAAARLRAAQGAAGHPCCTLHRLLESRGERFGRNRSHPLDLDLLVVDEVSMVDVPLMQALLDALPASCRLVLVGDAAQLPPVGPGSVLLDLQDPASRQALGPGAVQLQRTYRNNGALAVVAAALRQGDAALEPLLAALPPDANLQWLRQPPQQLPPALLQRLGAHQQQLQQLAGVTDLESTEATATLLAALERCLVLSPQRRGRWGVEAIHRALLGELLAAPAQAWPVGTPVLCQHNLVELGLANGDVGLVVEQQGERRLLFANPAGPPLRLHPAQLPAPQPALALTVHKAQGSEADEVWVLMDPRARDHSRLLYTALTRARQRAWLVTPASH
jgi:exodeoxyribonuclease V alpha subunit